MNLGRLTSRVEALQEVLENLAGRQLPTLERKLDSLHDLLSGQRKDHYLVDEVATLVGRSEYTVRRWIAVGNLKAVRITEGGPRGRLLVPRSELDRLVNDGKGAHVPETALSRAATGVRAT